MEDRREVKNSHGLSLRLFPASLPVTMPPFPMRHAGGFLKLDEITVLIADDDEAVRETLSESLLDMGFVDVIQTKDGEAALETLEGEDVHLLLLDLAMPRLRGEEVVEIALSRYPELIIIIVTGFATLEKAIQLMKKGIYDLIRKPFNPRTLARKIDAALLKQDARREGRKEGRNFGDFELLEEIARGGSSVVWKAREKETDDVVALKILEGSEEATDEQILRFHREARTVEELRHPYIVSVRRIGVHEKRHYIAMDFIEGLSLDEWIERNDPDIRLVLNVLSQTGFALHYAHEREILHRDLKPTNILVDDRNQPHLIDFGLAKSTREKLRITRGSRLHGTIGYIAPERFSDKGGPVGVESDIFSLGVILYEVLTGTLPYRMIKECDFLPDFSRSPASPSLFRPEFPAALSEVALKAVALRPEERYASARELAKALHETLELLT